MWVSAAVGSGVQVGSLGWVGIKGRLQQKERSSEWFPAHRGCGVRLGITVSHRGSGAVGGGSHRTGPDWLGIAEGLGVTVFTGLELLSELELTGVGVSSRLGVNLCWG